MTLLIMFADVVTGRGSSTRPELLNILAILDFSRYQD